MSKYWWTVWIKVGILAVVLLLAYGAAKKYVMNIVEPYLLDGPVQEASVEEKESGEPSGTEKLKKLVEKLEGKLNIYVDYENLIFDFANDYAKDRMEQFEKTRSLEK